MLHKDVGYALDRMFRKEGFMVGHADHKELHPEVVKKVGEQGGHKGWVLVANYMGRAAKVFYETIEKGGAHLWGLSGAQGCGNDIISDLTQYD
jgi:hypothetical protein